jgi:hypothetical protein
MKSHKEQSLLIGQNNSVTSLSALSIIEMEHMKKNEITDNLLNQIGLRRNEKYKLIDLIKSAQSRNIKIVSVCNHILPENFNPDIKEIANTDFKKRFFGSVLYDKREEGNNFLDIIEMLDNEYLITRMDIKSETTLDDSIFIIIKGSFIMDEVGTVSDKEERIMTLLFSN